MKVWNYVYLLVGVSILLELMGLDLSGTGILSAIGYSRSATAINFDFTLGTFFSSFLLIGTLAGAATGIIVGLFTRATPENYIVYGMVTGGTLTLFTGVITQIVGGISGAAMWIQGLTIIIIAPFAIGYLLALAEFLRGTD